MRGLSAVGGAPYTPYDVERSSLVEAWDAQGRPYYDYSKYNAGRLDAFAQLDVRVDKVFYFRRCMLGVYIDLQNVAGGRLRQPDVLMSTGEIENPSAPASERRYRMKYLEQVSGTLLPTLGLTRPSFMGASGVRRRDSVCPLQETDDEGDREEDRRARGHRPTSHVYVAGLPTGSCEGGKKVTMNENSTARNPTPPISHMPVFPPGTR